MILDHAPLSWKMIRSTMLNIVGERIDIDVDSREDELEVGSGSTLCGRGIGEVHILLLVKETQEHCWTDDKRRQLVRRKGVLGTCKTYKDDTARHIGTRGSR